MAKTLGVVEIEGRQYDAVTGQLVGAAKQAAAKLRQTASGNMDGFMKSSARSRLAKQPVVAKTALGTDRLPASADAQRTARARKIRRHHKVIRFGRSSAEMPKNVKSTALKAVSGEVVSRQVNNSGDPPPSVATATPVTLPSVMASHRQLDKLLDQALRAADAHKQARRGRLANQNLWQKLRRAPRWLSIGSAILAIMTFLGFFAWQNMPDVAMRVAASRSHLNASVPQYTPSGFSFSGPISYSNGLVTIDYTANGDANRSFSISQRASSWDSVSLLANYVVPSGQSYQTFQNKGSTVYIYGTSKGATWVDHGIWYNIKSNAKLNADQLLRIADSM